MDEKYKKLSYKISIFKNLFFFITDETTILEKIALRIVHRKGEEGAQAAPVTLPKQPLPRAQSSPVLWPQPPPPSQLLQC